MSKNETYEEFVGKFKPEKTTDDCYTPKLVYDAIADWVASEYGVDREKFVRPFYPGGDYEKFDYNGGIVVDNPPFSISSKIKEFYNKNGIRFFLFAPHLTLFSRADSKTNYIICNTTITYHNGAKINTDFVTNMGDKFIRTAPELKAKIEEAVKKSVKKNKNKMAKYSYPNNVTSSALLGKITNVEFSMQRNECQFVRILDHQKEHKKSIFGYGYLISDKKAAEIKAAEIKSQQETMCWQLSEREKEIIKNLNNGGNTT